MPEEHVSVDPHEEIHRKIRKNPYERSNDCFSFAPNRSHEVVKKEKVECTKKKWYETEVGIETDEKPCGAIYDFTHRRMWNKICRMNSGIDREWPLVLVLMQWQMNPNETNTDK
jgi:hypothetical protein